MTRPQGIWNDGWAVLRAYWHLRCATSLGPRARVWGRPLVTVDPGGQLIIGERLRLIATVARTELAVGSQGKLEIGDRVFINYGCSFYASCLVRIGCNCNFGTFVIMMDNDWHRLEPERRQERPESRPIILEENVWLGARVIVLRGVRIGTGSVIGAGSVVTRDIPPRVLAAGVPARVLRPLE